MLNPHIVPFVSVVALEHSAWAASRGETLRVYARPVEIERRVNVRYTN
jgi:hypothetical protein